MAEEDILHQEDVEKVIEEKIAEGVGQTQAGIADVTAAGGTYNQAHTNLIVDTLNAVLEVLRTSQQIEPEEE